MVTYSYPKVSYIGPKVTYSDSRITNNYPKVIDLQWPQPLVTIR